MDTIKFVLMIIGLLAVGLVGYLLVGFVFSLLWYVLIVGILAAVGYGGYKLLKSDKKAQIEDKQPVAISELKNVDRALEEYKRKYLPK